jgi:hypothetical protein
MPQPGAEITYVSESGTIGMPLLHLIPKSHVTLKLTRMTSFIYDDTITFNLTIITSVSNNGRC